MQIYFAYGSNMSDVQIKDRCPQSNKLGTARLHGYRWIITTRGYASIVESDEDKVEGVLFELSLSDEETLDKWEGVRQGSYRKFELPVIHNGKEVLALVYIDPVTAEGTAEQKYIDRINAGLADAKLSECYVTRYVRRFIPA